MLKVLYKDSFGSDSFISERKNLEEKIENAFNAKYKLEFKFNQRKEQEDRTSCGIFALQNTQIMAMLIQKNKNNFLANFENFDQFCSQHKANSLRQKEFALFYILGLSKQVKIDNWIKEQRNAIRQNHDEEIEQISLILEKSLTGVNVIPLLHNQSIEINQRDKAISVEIGTDEVIKSDYCCAPHILVH